MQSDQELLRSMGESSHPRHASCSNFPRILEILHRRGAMGGDPSVIASSGGRAARAKFELEMAESGQRRKAICD